MPAGPVIKIKPCLFLTNSFKTGGRFNSSTVFICEGIILKAPARPLF